MKTRPPTAIENAAIVDAMIDAWGFSRMEAETEVHGRHIVVIEGYISDGPGYRGNLYWVLGGLPEVSSFLRERREPTPLGPAGAPGLEFFEMECRCDGCREPTARCRGETTCP